jgi:hypothetical protein
VKDLRGCIVLSGPAEIGETTVIGTVDGRPACGETTMGGRCEGPLAHRLEGVRDNFVRSPLVLEFVKGVSTRRTSS